jgi:putative transposase
MDSKSISHTRWNCTYHIDGRVCKNHIHMYMGIPPKLSISEVMAYLKGKSALMLFDRHPEYRQKWGLLTLFSHAG